MEFKEYKLADITEKIYSGGTPSTKEASYWNGELKWLSSGETSNRFIISTEKTITQKGVENSSTKLAFKNDLVMASAGQGYTRGQTSFLKIDTYINQSLIAISVNKDKVHPLYLFYNLISRYAELRQISDSSSTRGSINTKMIKNLNIMIPEKYHQNRIVYLINGIDEKIEINKKIIANLEELSQTLFKRWFLDFEFPDKDGNPYKSSGGEMTDSELGKIPLNWSIKSIDEVADCQNGYAFYKTGYSDSGYFVMDLGNINTNSQYVTTNKDKYINKKDIDQKKEKFLLKTNDLVMIMTDRTQAMNILGRTVRITIPDYFVLNQRMFRIRVYDKYLLTYLQSLLNSEYTRQKFLSKSLGSAQKYINTKHITKHEIILPNDVLLKKYYSSCENIILQSIELNEENSKLTLLRDTLLPKLMSGELEIPDDIEVNIDEFSI